MTVLPQTIIPVNQTKAVGQRQRLGLKELTCQAPPLRHASPSGFEWRWSWATKERLLEAQRRTCSERLGRATLNRLVRNCRLEHHSRRDCRLELRRCHRVLSALRRRRDLHQHSRAILHWASGLHWQAWLHF